MGALIQTHPFGMFVFVGVFSTKTEIGFRGRTVFQFSHLKILWSFPLPRLEAFPQDSDSDPRCWNRFQKRKCSDNQTIEIGTVENEASTVNFSRKYNHFGNKYLWKLCYGYAFSMLCITCFIQVWKIFVWFNLMGRYTEGFSLRTAPSAPKG